MNYQETFGKIYTLYKKRQEYLYNLKLQFFVFNCIMYL